MPHREHYVFVCTNRREDGHPKGSCAERGSEEVLKRLKLALLERGASKTVRACASGCLDLCESGVAAVQEPAHVAYGHVTLDDIAELADAIAKGEVLGRLVVHGKAQ